jgi:hypothetical protein
LFVTFSPLAEDRDHARSGGYARVRSGRARFRLDQRCWGWLIFRLPPAELAAHPSDDRGRHELYLMCDEIEATVEDLRRKGVEFTRPVTDEGWGLLTAFAVPGGGELALYEPRHPSPLASGD